MAGPDQTQSEHIVLLSVNTYTFEIPGNISLWQESLRGKTDDDDTFLVGICVLHFRDKWKPRAAEYAINLYSSFKLFW